MSNSLEMNKIFAAILTAGVTFGAAGVIGRLIVHPTMPHHSAIQIGEPAPVQAVAAIAAPTIEPITPLLASANAQNGQQLAQRQCASCHSFNEGGRSGVGPNLHAIVGSKHAHSEGFNYSAAIRGMASKTWGYEELNAWIANPRGYVAGNKMTYAGLASVQSRADLIAYLRSISPNAPAP
jgi:cytochrome c